MERAYYIPGSTSGLDYLREGSDRTLYGKQTHEEVMAEHPDALLLPADEVHERCRQAAHIQYRKLPFQVTEDYYNEQLNCLPPSNWKTYGAEESFVISELLIQDIGRIFVSFQRGKYCFCLHDVYTLGHHNFVEMCQPILAVARLPYRAVIENESAPMLPTQVLAEANAADADESWDHVGCRVDMTGSYAYSVERGTLESLKSKMDGTHINHIRDRDGLVVAIAQSDDDIDGDAVTPAAQSATRYENEFLNVEE